MYIYIGVGVLVGLITVFFLILRWLFPHLDYWESQAIPCYNPGILQTWKDMRKNLSDLEMELYTKYGQVYGRYDGRTPVLTIADPEVLKEVLERDFRDFYNRRFLRMGDPIMDNMLSFLNDSDWKRVRGVMTPTFTTSKLKQMLHKVNDCSTRIQQCFDKSMSEKGYVDLETMFGAYILDVIACCAFGTQIYSLETPNNPFVKHAKMFFEAKRSYRGYVAQYFPLLMHFLGINLFNEKASKFFQKFVVDIIKERRTRPVGVDFLQMLLEFQICPGSQPHTSSSPSHDGEPMHQPKYINEGELISQCVSFFLAGYDTTVSLLQVAFYYLATNQDIQLRLYEEIMAVVGDKKRIELDDINAMKYLDAVVNEALRLTSTCIRMERQASNDHFIQSYNVLVKRGQLVSIPFYAIHHDPEHFPDPHTFDPERFTREAKAERNRFIFMPFGIGPRSCIGNRFALMEAKLCVITTIRRYAVVPSPLMEVPLKFYVKLGQHTPYKVRVEIRPRY